MNKKNTFPTILLVLFLTSFLTLYDCFLSQYYTPKPILDFIATLLFAFLGYFVVSFTIFTIPIILLWLSSRFLIKKQINMLNFILLAPFILGLLALIFVPDLYEIKAADWRSLLICLIGTTIFLKLYSYLLNPNKSKKLIIGSCLATITIYLTVAFFLNPSANFLPSKNSSSPQKSSTSSRPNFVLIVLDALRGDAINLIAGDNKIKTPNFDKFMSEGTVFINAFSNASQTILSMPSLFVSKYPSVLQAGNTAYIIPEDDRTITEDLKDRGYDTTAIIGSTILNEYTGITQGFDYYFYLTSYFYNNRYLATLPIFCYQLKKNSRNLVARIIVNAAKLFNLNPFIADGEIGIKLALDYLNSPQRRENPFFLWVHLMDPHDPYIPPGYKSDYSGTLPKKFFAPHNYHPLEYEFVQGEYVPTEEDKRHIRNLYNAEVENLDKIIAPLLKKIKEMDNTVVVITADHGEAFWEHKFYYHAYHIFREMIHVPLAFYGPNVPKGKKVSTPVTLINTLPTVRELLNIPPEKEDEGKSLTDLFSGDDLKKLPPNFIDSNNGLYGVFFNNYYLIKNNSHDDYIKKYIPEEIFLYDTKRDPMQQNNIKDKHPEVVAQGVELIEEFKKNHLRKHLGADKKEAVEGINKSLKSLGYIQ